MQYYMEYGLGWRGPSNKKADKGTIVHKVLEIAAVCKKGLQDGKKIIVDEHIGRVSTCNYKPEYLDKVIDRVYEYYTSRTGHHKWLPLDLKHCRKWVWKALEYNEVRRWFSSLVRGQISRVNITVKIKLSMGIQTQRGYKNGSMKNAARLIVTTNI